MMDKTDSDQAIRNLYELTKRVKSPKDLDDMILAKVQAAEELADSSGHSSNTWVYAAIAASMLLVFFVLPDGDDKMSAKVDRVPDIAKISVKKSSVTPGDLNKNQLPDLFLVPGEDVTGKIVPACTANLNINDGDIERIETVEPSVNKKRKSKIPIKPLYPNEAGKHIPDCDLVSRQILKK